MSIDKVTVEKIAHLARIEVAQSDLEHMAAELSNILDWVEQLAKVNTDDVPPMTSVVEAKLPWRKDEVTDGNRLEDILANAPEAEHGFFAVPKVIE